MPTATDSRQRTLRALFVVNLLVLVWLVWTPAALHTCEPSTMWAWLLCADSLLVHYGANLFLLVPTAAIALLLRPHVSRVRLALALLACTCLIELVQFWIPGRDPDLRDVIANALGAWITIAVMSKRATAR